jgi:hypothetical protein
MKKTKRPTTKRRTKNKAIKDDCGIPPPLPLEATSDFILDVDPKGKEDVLRYMAQQARDENVKHLEKIKSEKVLGTRYDVWDVITNKGRWWVISNPMNLYSHKHSPSLDYTLSFHIGLMTRLFADSRPKFSNQELFVSAWRKWSQAAEAYNQADEPEEYQAVGMGCRESLLAFIKEAASPELVPSGVETPRTGDFEAWSELLIKRWVHGSSAKQLRSYLINTARLVWQLVNWLTHSTSANNYDASIAVDATENLLGSLFTAFIRHSRGLPGRCSICGSYRVSSHFIADEMAYKPYCPACGWEGELYKEP